MVFNKLTLRFFLLLVFAAKLNAAELGEAHDNQLRIVTLSPHLTEIVFALGRGDQIVAVSDYSDFPMAASSIQSVASYEGANIAEIIRLQPTHILVWRGGNKDADIEKISQLGIIIHESSIDSVTSLMADIVKLGDMLNAAKAARNLVDEMQSTLNNITKKYNKQKVTSVYYLSTQPLIGLGNDKWLNSLLKLCGINNIYIGSHSAYPQLQMSHIIRSQPQLLIAASNAPINEIAAFWQAHKSVFDAKIVSANPDALHRFTPRAITEMSRVCNAVYTD